MSLPSGPADALATARRLVEALERKLRAEDTERATEAVEALLGEGPPSVVVLRVQANGSPTPGHENERDAPKGAVVVKLVHFGPGERPPSPPQEATVELSVEDERRLQEEGLGPSANAGAGERSPSIPLLAAPPDAAPAVDAPSADAGARACTQCDSGYGCAPHRSPCAFCGGGIGAAPHGASCPVGQALARASFLRFQGPNLPPLAEPRRGLEAYRLVGARVEADGSVSLVGEQGMPFLDPLEGFARSQEALASVMQRGGELEREVRREELHDARAAEERLRERELRGHGPSCRCADCARDRAVAEVGRPRRLAGKHRRGA